MGSALGQVSGCARQPDSQHWTCLRPLPKKEGGRRGCCEGQHTPSKSIRVYWALKDDAALEGARWHVTAVAV